MGGRSSSDAHPTERTSEGGDEATASVCERLEREPGDLRGKYVGVVRGRIVVADHDFAAVVRELQRFEPDRSKHFVVLAGTPQPSVIYSFGFE